ncbi:MAG TPA: zf-HC2 domain-containing protein [Planctomycetota bacterium]|nr:zf-HC2 domain-containing protein [Planctomycetota bacterium]
MRKFTCDEARAELSDALAGVIGRPEANVLEAHLLECDPCRSLAELFLWQDRVLAELAAEARMDQLMSRVREGLLHLDQVSIAGDEPVARYRRPSYGWVAAAAAFVLVLVGLLLWKPSFQSPLATPAAPAEAQGSGNADPLPEPEPTALQPPSPEPPAPQVVPPTPPPPVVVETPKVPPVTPVPALPQEPVQVKSDVPPAKVPAPDLKSTAGAGAEVVTALPKPRTLDEAVRGGMTYLRSMSAVFAKESRSEELLLWTYVQGGVPESDPEFQAGLKSLLEKKLEKTYNVALLAIVLEELDRVKYQKRLAQCAQYLLDNQCANGQWSYGDPSIFVESVTVPPPSPKSKAVRKVAISRKRDGPAAGDNSNTMYALLGLRACHDGGIILPPTSIELAAKWWRDSQTKLSAVKAPAIAPEGWCYGRHDHKPYGSMTAGGVGSLAICDYILGRDPKKDRELACGMEWLAKNFTVAYNPGPYEHANFEENSQHHVYYYLYALERAAILTGSEQIGGFAWYPRAAQALIDAQRPDGSWKAAAGGNELNDTCFAVLTLRRSTRALIDVATPKK